MSITSLELILSEVSDLFDQLVTDGDLVTNLDHPPTANELEGRSPVLSMHYGGGIFRFLGRDRNESEQDWVVTLFVNRAGHGNQNTEDLMGQLITKVVQQVRDTVTGTNYASLNLSPTQRIRPAFANIDGNPYRVCEIYLTSKTFDN